MNKARGHKKDVTRILKALKLQASATRYHETINEDSIQTGETKPYAQKMIYASNNRKNETSAGTKKRRYRYDRNTIQNENNINLGFRQQRSLDVRKDNFLKISQKYEQSEPLNIRNPYQARNKISSVVKQLRRSSNQPRRIITQQSTRPEPIRRNFHFKTIQSHQPLNIEGLIQQARLMSSNGTISESDLIIQRVLREDPQNKQALYLSGCNNYKQMNYLRCLTAFNLLLQIDPVYNKNAYIMSSICFNNKGQKEEAMLRINTCLSYFPDFYQAHFQKAKLYLKAQDMENAIKSLKKALRLAKEPYECCLKLGQCYQKQQMYDLALKLYEKIAKHPPVSTKEAQHRSQCLLKKAQCEKKLQRYQQSIKTLQEYLKTIQSNTLVNNAKILYQIGYCCYKINDYPNASMHLQEVFAQKSPKQSTETLILLTIINIKKRDFYEAYHCLLRKEHLQINANQLEFYEKFCQGVLCLMKRKFETGLERLIEMQSKMSQICKDQFQTQIAVVYPLYLSYAYFCFGRTDKCIKINKNLLESNHPELAPHRKGIQFNLALCQGIQQYKHKKLGAAKMHFEKSNEIYPHKPEGFLYLGITLIQLYLKDYNENLLKRAKAVLSTCINNLKQLNNNYSASVFYVKAVLSASMSEWDNAINQIDESIERAEDNDAKAFYLRSLILACCQNFKQAIGEASIAISLNNKEPAYYLLRSKCQQIEGEGNKAFLDLQQYIALCPDDTQIHKFAGHLLFENGAFEDALQAYDNGEITANISNYDVFLTRGKTYFLLGQFQKASADMQTAMKLKSQDPSVSFDICVIRILHDFFSDHNSNLWTERAQKAKEELENLAAVGQDIDYGRIFKKIQISMLLAMFLFYLGMYRDSARQFKETITMKQATFVGNQQEYEEELKQKEFFVAQMYYNRAMCYLMLSQPTAALNALQNCKLDPDSKTQSRLQQLICFLKNKKQPKVQKFEVFSQKNKMSRVLHEINIKLNSNDTIRLKLSIPFPKVEPPDINPKFQPRLIRQIDIEAIEKKPEAPWILREENSIKFTEKIQQFSRLQINNSELSKIEAKNSKAMCTQEQQFHSQYDNSYQSLSGLKQKLKLDDKIETKLNNILNKKKK